MAVQYRSAIRRRGISITVARVAAEQEAGVAAEQEARVVAAETVEAVHSSAEAIRAELIVQMEGTIPIISDLATISTKQVSSVTYEATLSRRQLDGAQSTLVSLFAMAGEYPQHATVVQTRGTGVLGWRK
jgi:hypothetical protein